MRYCDGMSKRSENEKTKIRVTRGFLDSASKMRNLIEQKKDTLENLTAMACRTTSRISSVSSGSFNPHAREELMVKKMDLEKEIQAAEEKLAVRTDEIILAIASVKNVDQQTALRYRFIEDLTNEKTAAKMHVEVRSVQRYVEAGCLAMKLPDRYYKKKAA